MRLTWSCSSSRSEDCDKSVKFQNNKLKPLLLKGIKCQNGTFLTERQQCIYLTPGKTQLKMNRNYMHSKNNLILNFQFLCRILNTDTFNHFICIAHKPQLHIKAAPMIHNGGILEYSFSWGRMDSTLWRKNQERKPSENVPTSLGSRSNPNAHAPSHQSFHHERNNKITKNKIK